MLAVRILQNRKHLTKYICVSNVLKREKSDDPTQPPKFNKNANTKKKNFKEKPRKKVIDPVSSDPKRQNFSSKSWKVRINTKNDAPGEFQSDFFQNLMETSAENVAKEFKKDTKAVKSDLLTYLKTFEVSREKLREQQKENYIISTNPSLRSLFKYVEPLKIFKENELGYSSDQVKLNIWNDLEKEELAYNSATSPANYFEEQIQWTKEGRLWHFPIDNDQGLEKEAEISFTEHIFMERHLEPWCPKKGPIRKFMEMVLIGLAKNPYLSVEDKKEHIEWFRKYFESKKKLLQELGAVSTTKEIESPTKEPKSQES